MVILSYRNNVFGLLFENKWALRHSNIGAVIDVLPQPNNNFISMIIEKINTNIFCTGSVSGLIYNLRDRIN